MNSRSPMTTFGHEFMQKELDRLKKFERPKAAKAIEVARAHGDLSENAEYDAAKDAQGMLEARIRQLEALLSTAQVVDISKLSGSKVVFGATVEIVDADTDERKILTIVGEDESEAPAGLISYLSPLARGLIGKQEDDFVSIKLPGGVKEYEIASVSFEVPELLRERLSSLES